MLQYDKLESDFNHMKAVNKRKAEELERSIETRVATIKKEFENKGRVGGHSIMLCQFYIRPHGSAFRTYCCGSESSNLRQWGSRTPGLQFKKKQGCVSGSGRFRTFFSSGYGSGSESYSGNAKLHKQGQNVK